MSRNYSTNLNKNLERLNKANYEVATSGRKIFQMSDDTATGLRAMKVRRSIDQLKSFQDNATNTKVKMDSAEKVVGTIAELATKVYERFNFALNDTNGETDREIIAQEFRKLQEEIVTSGNSQFAARYLFGGTNTMSPPFSIYQDPAVGDPENPAGTGGDPTDPGYIPPYKPAGEDHGKLMYNNVLLKDIPGVIDPDTGVAPYQYMLDDAAYADVGLGLAMDGETQNVNTNTAVKTTINGVNIMGAGEDNLYDTVTKLINWLEGEPTYVAGSDPPEVEHRPYDNEYGGELLDLIRSKADEINMERTRLGSESQYLEFTVSRLDTEYDNLVVKQDGLEFNEPSESIMKFTMQQYVYNASLQMGSRLLQNSLFDYMG
jgi:flagellin-like hook-associated protein FlgL